MTNQTTGPEQSTADGRMADLVGPFELSQEPRWFSTFQAVFATLVVAGLMHRCQDRHS